MSQYVISAVRVPSWAVMITLITSRNEMVPKPSYHAHPRRQQDTSRQDLHPMPSFR
jgi:hypothetical protein